MMAASKFALSNTSQELAFCPPCLPLSLPSFVLGFEKRWWNNSVTFLEKLTGESNKGVHTLAGCQKF